MLDDLGRKVLVAVDRLTRTSYGDTHGEAVVEELERMGETPPEMTLYNLFFRLRDDGYLECSSGGYGEPRAMGLVRLTSYGVEEARDVDPVERTYGEARHVIASAAFAGAYPAAFDSWAAAERLLWSDDAQRSLTTIGHHVREAMQKFATTLVETHQPPDVDPDPSQVERRLGAVIAMHRLELGKARREALEALGTLWERTNRLVQRQEHGAQKEGERIVWSDARRIVWLSLFCMFEFADIWGPLDP